MANLLVITIFLPLAGAALVWGVSALGRNAVRWTALGTTLVTLTAAVVLMAGFQNETSHTTSYAETDVPWLAGEVAEDASEVATNLGGVDIRFNVGLDGIGLWMFGLSALLMVTAVLVSWEAIDHGEPLFYSMLLLLECGCLGVFTSGDIILFYVFFEFTLIPLFFLIGVWGSEQRRYAAVKFFLFTLAGSVLTFLGLLTIVFWASGRIGVAGKLSDDVPARLTFSIAELTDRMHWQYARLFAAADRDNRATDGNQDGHIDMVDAVSGKTAGRREQADRTFRRLAFQQADADGNGRISWLELSSASGSGAKDAENLYQSSLFNLSDTNRDGKLTFEELKPRLGADDDEAAFAALKKLGLYGLPTPIQPLEDAPEAAPPNEPTLAEPEEETEEELTQPADGEAPSEDAAAPPADWSLSPQAFASLPAARWASVSDWEITPEEFGQIPAGELHRYGGWKFSREEIEAADFRLGLFVFLALFIGFAIKVPLFPLHTWLPLAHVQAPTAGSVILAGVLLKIGVYGFLRFNIPMLPTATAVCAPWLLGLAVAGILYGALVALAQADIKKLIAYSSVSHLGYCMLGLFALNQLGAQGAVLQMVNHGISTGALFALVGMLYERYHTRQISDYGGLARRLPIMAFFMVLFTMSSIGLPGLNGFTGEILILIGMFQRAWADAPLMLTTELRWFSVLAVLGVVLGAWYMLWLVQRVFFGPLKEPHTDGDDLHGPVRDLGLREIAALAPLAVLVVWIGLFPNYFLQPLAAPLKAPIAATQVPLQERYASDSPPRSQPGSVETKLAVWPSRPTADSQ